MMLNRLVFLIIYAENDCYLRHFFHVDFVISLCNQVKPIVFNVYF